MDLAEHFHTLLHDVLLDHLQDLVLLQELSGDVQRQIFGVHYSLDETQVLWDQILAVVHDEDSSNVQLDVILLLLGLEEVERGSLRHEQDGLELQLSFHGEKLDGQMVFPVVAQALIERTVLLRSDVFSLSHPDRLGLIDGLELVSDFLNLLGLLLLLLLALLLDLNVVLLLLLLWLVLVIFHVLLSRLLHHQLDVEGDELTVLLDQFLDPLLL